MNRLKNLSCDPSFELIHRNDKQVEQARCSAAGDAAFFAPLHYEAGYAYPLIIWLHGDGDDPRQLRRIMPLVSLRNYVATAPRGLPVELAPFVSASDEQTRAEESPAGFYWPRTESGVGHAEIAVFDAIAEAQDRFNIAPRRVFLAGLAAGGTMAMRLAFRWPSTFAGALSFGGAFPNGGAPLARVNQARKLRLLLASCRDSAAYPPEAVCRDLRLLHSAGMSINLRQYPCGDELTTNMLSDMDRWLMDQIAQQRGMTHETSYDESARPERGA